MYGVVNYMGEERGQEFFRKLSALKPEMRKGHIWWHSLWRPASFSICSDHLQRHAFGRQDEVCKQQRRIWMRRIPRQRQL